MTPVSATGARRPRRPTAGLVGELLRGVVLGLGLTIAVGVVAALALGLRPLTVLTGSMHPTLVPGDLVVDRMIPATSLRPGQIVTFPDAGRGGALVTHRVRLITPVGPRLAVVTRGDRNTGTERWTIPRDGRVGRVVLRLPRIGYASRWLRSPLAVLLVLLIPALLLGAMELRSIWTSDDSAITP